MAKPLLCKKKLLGSSHAASLARAGRDSPLSEILESGCQSESDNKPKEPGSDLGGGRLLYSYVKDIHRGICECVSFRCSIVCTIVELFTSWFGGVSPPPSPLHIKNSDQKTESERERAS